MVWELRSGMQLCRALGICAAILLSAAGTRGQNYDDIAAKYKNENAVYTNYTEKLVIAEEDGKLTANSHVIMEKLLLSDVSLSKCNKEYFAHGDFNKLTDLNAVSKVPSSNGYRTVPCNNFAEVNPDRDNVFYDDVREMVVMYSGLQKKTVTETRYSIEHTDLNMLPSFFFQEDLPIVKATFEVTAPRYVDMNFVLKGENTNWVQQKKEEKNGTVTYTFAAADIPAAKTYEDVPSVRYYIPHVIPYIASYKLLGASKAVAMTSNPDELYKYLYKYVKDINRKDDTAIARIVAKLTEDDKSPRDKAAHIYQWVQQNIHYIAFEKGMEGFVPREAAQVCKRKYGDCKDMTSILVAMCRKAGLDAYFTWIGTRHLPYTNEETPLSLTNNHMICALKLGDEWIFMDGTHPLIPFGSNPEGIQGKEAMVSIDAKNYKIITIPEEAAEKNVVVDSTYLTFTENNVSGSIKQYYKGYDAWHIGLKIMYLKNDDKDKAIKELTWRGSNNYLQNKYDVAVNDAGSKDVTINADFTIENYVRKAGKQYFVNMNLKRSFEDKRITDKDRKVTYYYKHKEREKEVVVLNIPKGYKVSYLPKPSQGSVDGLWNYKISYKADKNKITLEKEYELKSLTANSRQFDSNNKLVDDLKKAYNESVVLTAIN